MSAAFDRGRKTEREVAAMLRKKLGVHVQRDKQSGAGLNKADIKDFYQEIPLFIEVKNQQTLKVKEWMKQAAGGASVGQIPTLVFQTDDELLACLPFDKLIDLLLEIKQLRAEVALLREPVDLTVSGTPVVIAKDIVTVGTEKAVLPVVEQKIAHGAQACKSGHIADEYGYCMQLDCKFSRGYRPPKVKK